MLSCPEGMTQDAGAWVRSGGTAQLSDPICPLGTLGIGLLLTRPPWTPLSLPSQHRRTFRILFHALAPEEALRVLMHDRFLSSFIHSFPQQLFLGAVPKLISLTALYSCLVREVEW